MDVLTRQQAEALAARRSGRWRVTDRREEIRMEGPPPPYTTAELLADASRKLGWGAERTAEVAQRLFESGWITYPRTDSVRVAPEAADAARQVIAARYGSAWLGETFPQPRADDAHVQDAHEAIRPADAARPAEELSDPAENALYRLIRARFLAAYMRPARLKVIHLTLEKADA